MNRFLLPAEFVASHGTGAAVWTVSDSLAYTRWLARTHYENFPVVSFLLPRRLRQDFYNVYSFCRWADDLGDEIGDPQRSLELLDWWRGELSALYQGNARHPVYVALRETVAKHRLPQQPFADLIRAFVLDQTVTRYQGYDALLNYCRYSANPVGRLVLLLCGYPDEERARLSDYTCTALQLANFWQDVRRDWDTGRVYIPLADMQRHGYSIELLEQDLKRGAASPAFQRLMHDLVDRTHGLFRKGLPLVDLVDRRLAVDIDLFSRGGLAILEMIRRQGYDTIGRRPKLSKRQRAGLLVRALARPLLGRPRVGAEAQHAYH